MALLIDLGVRKRFRKNGFYLRHIAFFDGLQEGKVGRRQKGEGKAQGGYENRTEENNPCGKLSFFHFSPSRGCPDVP